MSEYENLKNEFERKVKELQEKCPHTTTKWYMHMWAPGHFSGEDILVCENCDKHLGKRPTQRTN